MSLNWKEINLVLEELSLEGSQIQAAVQSAYDVVILRVHKKGETKNILVSLSSGACRIHETFIPVVKTDKPLRFAQFLNSRIVNGRIIEAMQLGDNRIVRLAVNRGEFSYKLYIRLWSNAANFIVTDDSGTVLDAMRRLPKKGEVTGGKYQPEMQDKSLSSEKPAREYEIRSFKDENAADGISFSKKIDRYYAAHAGTLSLDALKDQARRNCEGSIGRISASLERLREKEASFEGAWRFKEYGDLILSNIAEVKQGAKWLEADRNGALVRIELDPKIKPAANAQNYYEKYRKAKNGLSEVQREIEEGQKELERVKKRLERLLNESNPLVLAKLLAQSGAAQKGTAGRGLNASKKDKARPGLSFRRGDWLIIVGRDASENDELLRRYVKGNDLWLHARDYAGSYVFIKQRAGKTVPLNILLDAGNLAIFYSKGRNNEGGDLFYTPVKYLRRAKNGPKGKVPKGKVPKGKVPKGKVPKGKVPKGLVIPTQEKNLHIKIDQSRLRELEDCRV